MFNGLEQNARVIEPDPIFPLNDPDMKLCVNVLSAARPNYLYICLDSIFRNTVFKTARKPDVNIYIDILANGDSYVKPLLQVIKDFPVRSIWINEAHKGISANYWYSFNKAFDSGYDYCVLIEEDWLITTDALQWLYDCPKIAAHYSLYRWDDRLNQEPLEATERNLVHLEEEYTLLKEGAFLSWCLAFSKESFEFIYSIIKSKAYYGLYYKFPTLNQIRRMGYKDMDRLLKVIFQHYKLLCMVPPVSKLAHFGSRASHKGGYGCKGNRHQEMFAGEKEGWLDNVIALFNSTNEEEKALIRFYPLKFQYT